MISKKRAKEIARSNLSSIQNIVLNVIDGHQYKSRVYGEFDWDNLWVIQIIYQDKNNIIEPTRILLIDKKNGKILHTGYSNDEG